MTARRTAPLRRVQRRHAKAFVTTPRLPAATVRRPARVAVMLALARHIELDIQDGRLTDQAEAARRLDLSRARLTQLLALLLLAPDIQEAILRLEAVDGLEYITERDLRPITRVLAWSEQRALWRQLVALRAG